MPTIVLRLFLLEELAELVRASELSPDTTGGFDPFLVEPGSSDSVATVLQRKLQAELMPAVQAI